MNDDSIDTPIKTDSIHGSSESIAIKPVIKQTIDKISSGHSSTMSTPQRLNSDTGLSPQYSIDSKLSLIGELGSRPSTPRDLNLINKSNTNVKKSTSNKKPRQK